MLWHVQDHSSSHFADPRAHHLTGSPSTAGQTTSDPQDIMTVIEAIRARRSIKKFSDTAVTRDQVEALPQPLARAVKVVHWNFEHHRPPFSLIYIWATCWCGCLLTLSNVFFAAKTRMMLNGHRCTGLTVCDANAL
jgi:hypothetical protein